MGVALQTPVPPLVFLKKEKKVTPGLVSLSFRNDLFHKIVKCFNEKVPGKGIWLSLKALPTHS